MNAAAPVKAKAALVRKVGGPFTLEEVDVAAPRDHEVRVKMVAVGMCHTDLVARDGFPIPMPIVLGHEGAGVVESVGAKVKGVKAGDHVVLSFNSCAACPSCGDHQPAYCYNFLANNFSGVRPADGTTPLSQGGTMVHGNFFGQPGNLMKSPFTWKQYGQSGRWMTDLFPALSQRADDSRHRRHARAGAGGVADRHAGGAGKRPRS